MKGSHITYLIELTIIVIAISSFFLSYTNLYSFALSIGIPALHCPLFPICIDFFLIACSLYILYAGENKLDEREGWAFLIIFTIVSIVFNVQQSIEDGFWGIVGHATPPVSLCISLHIGMSILKHELYGHFMPEKRFISMLIPVEKGVKLCDEDHETDETTCEMVEKCDETDDYVNEIHEKVSRYLKNEPDAPITQISEELRIAYNTAKKYKDMCLNETN